MQHFGSPVALLPFADETKGYIALTTLVINLLVVVLLTFALRAMGTAEGTDQTSPDDYHADADDPRVGSPARPGGTVATDG